MPKDHKTYPDKGNAKNKPSHPASAEAHDSNTPHSDDVYSSTSQHQTRPNPWFRRSEWWLVITNALIITVGGVTAIIFYYQFSQMSQQTLILNGEATETSRQAKLDARAWINIQNTFADLKDGMPVRVPVRVLNAGKTPARRISATFVTAMLKPGQDPHFSYERSAHPITFDVGAILPNVPVEVSPELADFQQLPPNVRQDIANGNRFLIIYGTITYWDVFGDAHWIKFCSHASQGALNVQAIKCNEYNDTDDK